MVTQSNCPGDGQKELGGCSGLIGQPNLAYLVSSRLMRDLVSTKKVDSTQEMAVRVVLLAPYTCMYTYTWTYPHTKKMRKEKVMGDCLGQGVFQAGALEVHSLLSLKGIF